jgi:hypothetical protein
VRGAVVSSNNLGHQKFGGLLLRTCPPLVASRHLGSAEVQPNYYVVRDADGQQIAYVYYSNDPDRRSAAKLLSKDEARRIAANIAKLLDLLGGD